MNRQVCRIAVVLWLAIPGALLAEDSWKAPLALKARLLEQGIQQKHNILGLYPSMVEIPRDGGVIDRTTTNPFADVQHAVCWTSNYLAGLSYRYAFLEKSGAPQAELLEAKTRVDQVFEAVYRCQRVTGVRGLQARGYFLGHGETYGERASFGKWPYWHQGTVDGQDLRFVTDPSHHNYSDAIHGLGQYYTLAARGAQKDRAREAIDSLVSYWVDNNLNIADLGKDRPLVPILGFTDGKTLNTRVFMAIAGARVAYHATGKEKFKKVFDRLVDQYGLKELKRFKTDKSFDDDEHVFSHLDLLWRIETDAALRAAYRKVADGLWANHKNDAQSLFSYIYFNLAPDAPEKEKALREALFSLQTYPADTTVRPHMNSLFPERKPPYPTCQAALDNEYVWKGSLLQGDGWLSRVVTDVAVSSEDPQVLFAVGEEGGLYQSRDGAATWQNWLAIDQNLKEPVRSVACGPRSRILAVAADDGFYLTETGGASWKRLPVPAEAARPVDILFDTVNARVLYAIGSKGVYRSKDFGEEYVGQSWECLTDGLPVLEPVRWIVVPGKAGRMYAVSDYRIFTRSLDNPAWTRGADFGIREYTRPCPWVASDPRNPDRLVVGMQSSYREMGTLTILQETTDAGKTWSNDQQAIFKIVAKAGIPGLIAAGIPSEVHQVVIDSQNPSVLYAAVARGVLQSNDRGKTWQSRQEGLEIPLVKALVQPQGSKCLFAGTPGGLYVSKDAAGHWTDANLWLQFAKNTRRDLGGAAFIDAYWRARFYGLIDDATAQAPCTIELR